MSAAMAEEPREPGSPDSWSVASQLKSHGDGYGAGEGYEATSSPKTSRCLMDKSLGMDNAGCSSHHNQPGASGPTDTVGYDAYLESRSSLRTPQLIDAKKRRRSPGTAKSSAHVDTDRQSSKRPAAKLPRVVNANDVAPVGKHGEKGRVESIVVTTKSVSMSDKDQSKGHDKYCHFCQHVKINMLACTTAACTHRYCLYCLGVHLGDETEPATNTEGKWQCPTCRCVCCCSTPDCSRQHRHCKAFRYRLRRADAANLRATAAHALVSLAALGEGAASGKTPTPAANRTKCRGSRVSNGVKLQKKCVQPKATTTKGEGQDTGTGADALQKKPSGPTGVVAQGSSVSADESASNAPVCLFTAEGDVVPLKMHSTASRSVNTCAVASLPVSLNGLAPIELEKLKSMSSGAAVRPSRSERAPSENTGMACLSMAAIFSSHAPGLYRDKEDTAAAGAPSTDANSADKTCQADENLHLVKEHKSVPSQRTASGSSLDALALLSQAAARSQVGSWRGTAPMDTEGCRQDVLPTAQSAQVANSGNEFGGVATSVEHLLSSPSRKEVIPSMWKCKSELACEDELQKDHHHIRDGPKNSGIPQSLAKVPTDRCAALQRENELVGANFAPCCASKEHSEDDLPGMLTSRSGTRSEDADEEDAQIADSCPPAAVPAVNNSCPPRELEPPVVSVLIVGKLGGGLMMSEWSDDDVPRYG